MNIRGKYPVNSNSSRHNAINKASLGLSTFQVQRHLPDVQKKTIEKNIFLLRTQTVISL